MTLRAARAGDIGAAAAFFAAPSLADRIVALLPYLVPLLDGLRYSRFFFSQFPQAIVLLTPLQPIASKAWPSSRRLASVLSGVRCTFFAYQVEPISTRRCC